MKADLKMTDEVYRNLLFKVAKVRSAKDLTPESYHKVVDAMMGGVTPTIRRTEPKKPIITFPSKIKPRVWSTVEVKDAEWNRFPQIMAQMEKQGIVLIAKWDADGRKYFRTRPA
jgi:hypothetical protein